MDGGYTREQRLSAAARLISEYERQVGIPMEESAIGPILAGGSPAAAAEERVEDVAETEPRAAEDVGDVDVIGTEAARAVGVAVTVVVGALLVV